MTEIENLREENKKLKEDISFYKPNGSVAFYYELNRFINSTVLMMRNQSLESLMTPKKDEDPKKFERMMALIKNAKEHVIDMAEIKSKLKLSGNEEQDSSDIPFIENVAETRR